VKDDLIAGRVARPKTDGLTVGELCVQFLQAKDVQLAAGELRTITWLDYKYVSDRVVAKFGKTRAVSNLHPEDFAALRESFARIRFGGILDDSPITGREQLAYDHDPLSCAAPFAPRSMQQRYSMEKQSNARGNQCCFEQPQFDAWTRNL
jgi:hypothetical protein